MARGQGTGSRPAKEEAPETEGRPMVGITIREVTYRAVGMQREAVDGDVLFRGEIAADVTPGELFQMLGSGKARFVDIEEAGSDGG